MAKKITATEAARNFSDFVARVNLRGDVYLLTRHGKVVAQLAPVPDAKTIRLADMTKALDSLSHLDAKVAADLEKDIERGRRIIKPPEDPWASS